MQDVPNRPSNPYTEHTLFVTAPLKNNANGGSINYIFPSHLFLTNKNASITIQADFGDGRGTQSYALDTPFPISFSGTGSKQITFTVKFSDNQTYKCYSTLYVDNIDSTYFARYAGVDDSWSIDPDITKAGGKVSVLYGSTGGVRRTSIIKPLIIAEGYDISFAAPDLATNYPNLGSILYTTL